MANSGAAYLGTVVTTSANEAVKVHVNGRAHNAINDDERTQYDGIAYRLVSTGNGNTFANWYLGNGIDGPGGSTVTLTPKTVSGTTTVTATTSGPQPKLFLRVQVNQN